MFTKQLAAFLANEIRKTDISGRSPADMAERIERLRGYGLLPRGRGKNLKRLSLTEVASGILSVVTVQPGFAGLAAKVLMGLCPVGGIEASFVRCSTFGKAIEVILTDPDALSSLIKVRVSDSEIGTNSNGLAAIDYVAGDAIKTAYYIGSTAVSVLQPGAEKTFDPSKFSPVVTETIFYPSFFKRLDQELKRKIPEMTIPMVDDEDAEEDRKEERAQRLGIQPGSRFLNIGVDNQVDWPNTETAIEFEGHKLILMPKTKDHTTSIHIDLHGQKISMENAQTLINRFLSLLTWCDDQFAVAQDGWSGNPVPVAVPKRNLAFTTAAHWIFSRKIPQAQVAKKALALYRQGRNAEQNYLVSYAVLSYYKIIELKHKGKEETKKWLRDNWPPLKEDMQSSDRIVAFEKDCGTEKPHEYLHKACRVAVSHASEKTPPSDPDDLHEIRRLHVAAEVLRLLARRFIKTELGLSDCGYDGS